MNLLKGFALIVVGFIGGFFFTSIVLEDSIDKTLQVQKDIQDIVLDTVVSANDTRLNELRASIQLSNALLQSYRESIDTKDILYSHVAKFKEELAFQKQIESSVDEKTSETIKELEQQILKLEEDVEFYIGPL